MNEYNLNIDMFNHTDEFAELMDSVNNLTEPDKIILFLYAETQSYRKLAKLLDVSFATAYKSIKKIREKIIC